MLRSMKAGFRSYFGGSPLRVAMATFVTTTFVLGYSGLIRMHLPFVSCDCSICRPMLYLDDVPTVLDYGRCEILLVDEQGNVAVVRGRIQGIPVEDRLEIMVQFHTPEEPAKDSSDSLRLAGRSIVNEI